MITLYAANTTSWNSNGICILLPSLCTIHEIAGGDWELTMEHPMTDDLRWAELQYDRIIKAPVPLSVPDGEAMIHMQCFRIYQVEVDTAQKKATVYARHVSYDLRGNVTGPLNLKKKKLPAAITAFKSALLTRDSVQRNITTDLTNATYTGDLSYQNAIYCLLDPDEGFVPKTKAMLVRDNFNFHILQNRKTDRGYVIDYGKNMIGVTWTKSTEDVVTRIIPIGQDDQGERLLLPAKWVDSSRINQYPFVRMATLEVSDAHMDSDTTRAQCLTLMTNAARDAFNEGCDLASLELEVDFVHLGDTAEYAQYKRLQRLYLYDTVTINHTPAGFHATAQVREYEWDAILLRYNKILLGDVYKVSGTVVSGYQIQSGAVTGGKIAAEAVGSMQLRQLAVTNAKIGYAAVQQANIEAAAVGSAQIASASIDVAHIKNETVASLTAQALSAVSAEIQRLAANEITTDELYAALARISSAVIQRATITAAQILDLQTETARIADAQIAQAEIDAAQVQNLASAAISAIDAEIARLVAGDITTDSLYANIARIANAAITSAVIYSAQITDLSAHAAVIENGRITNASLDAANVNNLNATIADVFDARIETAHIDWANITHTVGETAIVTRFVGDQMFIDHLAITDANIVSLAAGELMLKDQNGQFVRLTVDEHGDVCAQPVLVEGSNIANSTINGDSKIIEGTITARTLNVQDIFANSALIKNLIAANIDVDTLFAREATIGKITTGEIAAELGRSLNLSSNESITLKVQGEVAEQMQNAAPVVLRIDSSRGVLFKNNAVSTVLSVTLFYNGQVITDSTTMRQVLGNRTYLQWEWLREGDNAYGIISAADPRLEDSGFRFVCSSADVDVKTTFRCKVIMEEEH